MNVKEIYKTEVMPVLQKEFGYANVMSIPKIEKVVINIGVGRISKETKQIEKIVADLAKITGQKPSVRPAKKSIAGFKVREGMPVGYKVTLRGKRMYDFIDRLVSIALPRSRDFRGIELSNVDKAGNLNMGIKEHSIFPEVSYESIQDIFGLQITITTTAKTREEGIALFRHLGFPLKQETN